MAMRPAPRTEVSSDEIKIAAKPIPQKGWRDWYQDNQHTLMKFGNAHIPGGMGSSESVQFFENLCDPYDPYVEAMKQTQGGHWITPYTTRMKSTVVSFLKLKKHERLFVIGAREDGLHYRGEPFDQFAKVADEFVKIKRMPPEERQAYRKKTMDQLLGRSDAKS